ncbi:MAG: sporulation protein YtfJ [Clostridiales bacterium GWB2_37_7]|nr:MAG: sporulation protein YtfJ [Clostridiales bacterium GWB2_37_7]
MQQPVENLMKTTMESIKKMIDVNTVVGDPVETKDGTIAIPISRVCYAFVAGGGDLAKKNEEKPDQDPLDSNYPFAGGTGAGVTIMPIGFLTSSNGQLRMLPMNYNNTVDRIIDMVPSFIENIDAMIKNRHNDNSYS